MVIYNPASVSFTHYACEFYHHILGGMGVYFLCTMCFGIDWRVAAVFGVLFSFNHQFIVYNTVAHGGKFMTAMYLPWVLLFTIKVHTSKHWVLCSMLLAMFFGLMFLAMHMQVAYYGIMMAGLYMLFELKWKRALACLVAMALGFGLASPLYLQIIEYSQYSQRA